MGSWAPAHSSSTRGKMWSRKLIIISFVMLAVLFRAHEKHGEIASGCIQMRFDAFRRVLMQTDEGRPNSTRFDPNRRRQTGRTVAGDEETGESIQNGGGTLQLEHSKFIYTMGEIRGGRTLYTCSSLLPSSQIFYKKNICFFLHGNKIRKNEHKVLEMPRFHMIRGI